MGAPVCTGFGAIDLAKRGFGPGSLGPDFGASRPDLIHKLEPPIRKHCPTKVLSARPPGPGTDVGNSKRWLLALCPRTRNFRDCFTNKEYAHVHKLCGIIAPCTSRLMLGAGVAHAGCMGGRQLQILVVCIWESHPGFIRKPQTRKCKYACGPHPSTSGASTSPGRRRPCLSHTRFYICWPRPVLVSGSREAPRGPSGRPGASRASGASGT